jgi:hypothetical protein
VAGAVAVAPLGYLILKVWGAQGVLYLAALVYAVSAAINLRLPHPGTRHSRQQEVGPRGRIKELTIPSIGAVGMRAASGFLLFLLAFSLKAGHAPTSWFAVLAFGGVAGGFLADLVAPRLPTATREEAVVIACLSAACIGAVLAFEIFGLPILTVFAVTAGAAGEFGRLAFQSLMQRNAPAGAMGRVFVRYEVLFQIAWVGGAFLPAILPIDFRLGILILAAFYATLGFVSVYRQRHSRQA